MKKTILTFILMVALICSGLIGQNGGSSALNGFNWIELGNKDMNKGLKGAYLRGVFEGANANLKMLMDAGLIETNDEETNEKISKMDLSPYYVDLSASPLGQIVDGVDELYRDYANRHIPVFAIANLVNRRIRGKVSDLDFPKDLEKLRAVKWN